MSIQEQLEDVEIEAEGLADKLARNSIPGKSNRPVFDGLETAAEIVPEVIEDLNNWFEIVDVRIYNRNHIAIPMRYRWSIIRWARNDMDNWLMERGWKDMAHLNADSRRRIDNEMEARYRKNFDGIVVDTNFLVEFPDVVFRKLNGEDVEEIEERQYSVADRKDVAKDIVKSKRS